MSIALTGTGGLYTRWGKLIYTVNQTDTFRGATTDALVLSAYGQYNSNEQIAVDSLYRDRDNYRTVHATWIGQIMQVAKTTVIEQANRDNVLPAKTVLEAVKELKSQMEANSQSINRPTVAATPASGAGNDGSAVLVASVVGTDGLPQDYALAETFALRSNGGTAYAESVVIQGDPSRATSDYNWPGGSGINSTLTIVNGSNTTRISNGSFETWPTATEAPTGWLLVTGTWNTNLNRSSDKLRTSESYALEMASDGSTQLRFRQVVTLQPSTVYSFNAWIKIDSAAAGTLTIKLTDGSGTTINDEAGTANSLAVNTSTQLSASYAAINTTFRTPRLLPSTVHLDFHLTTPPANGREVTIDVVALEAATLLYNGGPYASLFSGATANPVDDTWTLAVTNSLTTSAFARSLDRFLDLRSLNIKIPSASSPTIPDNLIG